MLQSTILCTLPTGITTNYPLCLACRLQSNILCTLLPILQPTVCSALSCDTPSDYLLCSALSGDHPSDYLLCSTVSGDATTKYPLYSAYRYFDGLFTLLYLAILQPIIRSTLSGDAPTYYPICSTVSGDTATNYPILCTLLYSVYHHYNRLSALLRDSDGVISKRDRATIHSALLPILQEEQQIA
jgi:hypothetical protein